MKLIIFTGAPASGKSSIAETVGKEINTKVISKDGFKIELFEKFGFKSHTEKKKLSIKGEKIMYECIEKFIKNDVDLIVDNNFKNFDEVRNILKKTQTKVNLFCINCIADYSILAYRYNKRIIESNRHQALYTLNQYPVIEGVSKFHPIITKDDVKRIEEGVTEHTFGQNILEIRTDNIENDFSKICKQVIEFIYE